MDLFNFLPTILLVLGIVLLVLAIFLRYETKNLQKAISSLYELNQAVKQDTLEFIDQSWVILHSFKFKGMFGEVNWFGEVKEIKFGVVANKSLVINIQEENIKVKLHIYFPNKKPQEFYSLLELIVETYTILLKSNIYNKRNELMLSQQRLENFQLFMQHDIKNVAQFISLLESQVILAKSVKDKVKLCEHLNILLPSMSKRAKKISQPMILQSQKFTDKQTIQLHQEIALIAQIAGVKFEVKGKAKIKRSKMLVQQVFENLLENFSNHLPSHSKVNIVITLSESKAIVTLAVTNQKIPFIPPERAFEPFWTTSQSGMGLGLFIVRELLKTIGGDIKLVQEKDAFGFMVWL